MRSVYPDEVAVDTVADRPASPFRRGYVETVDGARPCPPTLRLSLCLRLAMSMLTAMTEGRTPVVTADLTVLGATAADSARLRNEHLWPVVVDANVLIEDVLWISIQRKRRSALWAALAVGTVRLLGKNDLLDEVLEHLPEAAGDPGPRGSTPIAGLPLCAEAPFGRGSDFVRRRGSRLPCRQWALQVWPEPRTATPV